MADATVLVISGSEEELQQAVANASQRAERAALLVQFRRIAAHGVVAPAANPLELPAFADLLHPLTSKDSVYGA
jgi:hypothetical protein